MINVDQYSGEKVMGVFNRLSVNLREKKVSRENVRDVMLSMEKITEGNYDVFDKPFLRRAITKHIAIRIALDNRKVGDIVNEIFDCYCN